MWQDIWFLRGSMYKNDLLNKKRVLVTGGGTGLGKAMARKFLFLGATVYLCGRREKVLRETQQELGREVAPNIHFFVCDVRDREAVESMMEEIWQQGPLDVLVNNAAGNFLARTEELSERAFEAVIGIVLMGTIHCTMTCGRRWLAAKRPGVVLNITTTYTESGSAYVVPSAMAKAGVAAMTRSLAVEWGPRGIRFVGIAPGPIPTEGAFSRLLPSPELEKLAIKRNPLRRFGKPEELADLAAFLISDGAAYINGEIVTLDGGEWLAGAGEFSYLGEKLSEEEWKAFRPTKK
jgi:NAD(P)-dependent dehydrogenase (short-subunit alcohol dehydrogenase family)